jgi:uncharacterized protein (TIGR00369 family)
VTHTAKDPDFERRVRDSFVRQRIMHTLGAELAKVAPGEVEIRLAHREELVQQHGFLHAGVIATILDSACGYAALTLMPPGSGVLAVEFKTNFLSPADGELVVARGRVIRSGRTLSVCNGEAHCTKAGGQKLVATMLSTVMAVQESGLTD